MYGEPAEPIASPADVRARHGRHGRSRLASDHALHAASAVPSGPKVSCLPAPVWKGHGPTCVSPVTGTLSSASAAHGPVLRRARCGAAHRC